MYGDVNNGVYRCGFAGSQDAYEKAYRRLFDQLLWKNVVPATTIAPAASTATLEAASLE